MALNKPISQALKIASIYAAVGVLWIVFSDKLTLFIHSDITVLSQFQTAKGISFVLMSATLIFFLINRKLKTKHKTLKAFQNINILLHDALTQSPYSNAIIFDESQKLLSTYGTDPIITKLTPLIENIAEQNNNEILKEFNFCITQLKTEKSRQKTFSKVLINSQLYDITALSFNKTTGKKTSHYIVYFTNVNAQIQQFNAVNEEKESLRELSNDLLSKAKDNQLRMDRLTALINTIPLPIITMRLQADGTLGKTIDGNEEAATLFSCPLGSLHLIKLQSFLAQDNKDYRLFTHNFNNEPEAQYEILFSKANETPKPLTLTCKLNTSNDNPFVSITIKDLTSVKQAQSASSKVEHINKLLFDHMEEGIIVLDNKLNIARANRFAESILFTNAGELIGQPFLDVVQPSNSFSTSILSPVLHGRTTVIDNVHFAMNPSRRYSCIAIPTTQNKQSDGIILLLYDKTEISLKEQEVLKLNQRINELSSTKDLILKNISHEIRTPMNAILGFTELLSVSETSDENQEYIEIIRKKSYDLLNVVNEMVDISLIESNQIVLFKTWVTTGEWLSNIESWALEQLRISNKPIQFNTSANDIETVKINIDSQRLTQVIQSILDNSIQNTHSGSISVSADLINDFLKVEITDTGVGMQEGAEENLLSPFVNLELSEIRKGGIGLGLTIAKALMNEMNGQIKVKSKLGEGTTVTITMPVESEGQILSDDNTAPQLYTKALIIDDIEDNLFLVKEMLSKAGIDVLTSVTGTDAIEVFIKHPEIDIVFCDLRLPDIDGFKVVQSLKRINPRIIVIAQTAFVLQNDRKRCLEAGFSDYLSKPINYDALQKVISKTY